MFSGKFPKKNTSVYNRANSEERSDSDDSGSMPAPKSRAKSARPRRRSLPISSSGQRPRSPYLSSPVKGRSRSPDREMAALEAIANAERERMHYEQAQAMDYGLNALRRWAESAENHGSLERPHSADKPSRVRSRSPSARSGSQGRAPSRAAFGPGYAGAMEMLAEVKGALGSLRADSPCFMPLDPRTGAPGWVTKVELNKLQLAMKRRRMKPLPSMPTQQDIISAIVRLQKDAGQNLDGEVEMRRSLDLVNGLSLTLMQAFTAMAAVAETCVEDAEAVRHEAALYTEEMQAFKTEYVDEIRQTLEDNRQEIWQLREEVKRLRGEPKTARIGGVESLHDVHATTVKLISDLQSDVKESLDLERSERTRTQERTTDRLTTLQRETMSSIEQASQHSQRTVEKEVSKVSRALSELVDQVSTSCEDVKDESQSVREEMRAEVSSCLSKLTNIRTQVEALQQQQQVAAARVNFAEKRQEAVLNTAAQQNKRMKDEIGHVYGILSRQLSDEMSLERARITGNHRGGVGDSLKSSGFASSASGLQGSLDFSSDPRDEDVRKLEARLESFIESSKSFS